MRLSLPKAGFMLVISRDLQHDFTLALEHLCLELMER